MKNLRFLPLALLPVIVVFVIVFNKFNSGMDKWNNYFENSDYSIICDIYKDSILDNVRDVHLYSARVSEIEIKKMNSGGYTFCIYDTVSKDIHFCARTLTEHSVFIHSVSRRIYSKKMDVLNNELVIDESHFSEFETENTIRF
jgi:hypothetical protein